MKIGILPRNLLLWGECMSSVSYGISVDRDAGAFDIQVDYFIEGYSDPETGEYFGETNWQASFGGGYAGSGTGGEGDSPIIDLGLGGGETLTPLTFNFYAQNWFTGVSVAFDLNILVAAYSTLDLTAIGTAGVDVAITGSGNDVIRGYGGNDYLDAGGGDDIVDGGAGNDRMDGGAGNDTLIGGADNDYLSGRFPRRHDRRAAGGGTDTVLASVSYTLDANVEQPDAGRQRAPLNGTGNDDANRIDGNGETNTLTGLGGDDILNGDLGNDILEGGAGNDRLDRRRRQGQDDGRRRRRRLCRRHDLDTGHRDGDRRQRHREHHALELYAGREHREPHRLVDQRPRHGQRARQHACAAPGQQHPRRRLRQRRRCKGWTATTR